jgi:hypothetical protein
MRRAGALLLISLDDVEEQLCVVEARDPGVDKNEREGRNEREWVEIFFTSGRREDK